MDDPLKVGDTVEILQANGVGEALVGQKGTVIKLPDADRATVEIPGLLIGNFRRSVLKKEGS